MVSPVFFAPPVPANLHCWYRYIGQKLGRSKAALLTEMKLESNLFVDHEGPKQQLITAEHDARMSKDDLVEEQSLPYNQLAFGAEASGQVLVPSNIKEGALGLELDTHECQT